MPRRSSSEFRLAPGQYREVPGTNYRTPKELWGFCVRGGSGRPRDVAESFLKANDRLLGLEEFPIDYRGTRASVGGWHVIFDQHYGKRIHRAYVSVHMNRDHDIYLVKNRAVPVRLLRDTVKEELGLPFDWKVQRAYKEARDRAALEGGSTRLLQAESVWFPVRSAVRPAFKFRFRTSRKKPPPRRHEWIIYVDAQTGHVLSLHDNLARAHGRARIFNPNPVVALADWESLLDDGKPKQGDDIPDEAYEMVILRDIVKSGVLSGKRANTSRTPKRIRRRHRDFSDLEGSSRGFEEVMAYFHVDSAIRYVEDLGYRGKRRLFTEPLAVNAHATRKDNSQFQSYYAPYDSILEFGYGGVDDAEDGETILHEFGHALQDKICPDFGQSVEGAAMGEGFGDYLAASYFAEKKRGRAAVLRPTVMSWDAITSRDPEHPNGPPCLRRVDSRLTYESFRHSAAAKPHRNGKIWSATLWDIWTKIGRDAADAIIIESHFQLDAFTTFARGARATIDADRNLFDGEHVRKLRRIFHQRGIGPVD